MLHIIARYARRQTDLTIGLGLLLAALYVFFAVSQLLTYEKLPAFLADAFPGVAGEYVTIWVACLAIAEVFSVPFFLGMQLSAAMRGLSAAFGFIVAGYIVFLGYVTTNVTVLNTGLAGGYIGLPGGWWMAWFGAGILLLVVWYTVRSVAEAKTTRH
jgi:glucan phosphoethanolaminetransferase (alkaline phosphatase superfamily)